jgi:hypothetical protein
MRETTLERLLRLFPDERVRLRPYVDRAKTFQNECGCAMSGFFMTGSLVALTLYGLLGHRSSHLTRDVPVAVALVFGAGVLGKVVGVVIARLRLTLLYRRLRVEYSSEGD